MFLSIFVIFICMNYVGLWITFRVRSNKVTSNNKKSETETKVIK